MRALKAIRDYTDSGKKVLLPLTHITLLTGLIKVNFLAPKGMGGFVTKDELDAGEKRELFNVLKKIKILYCSVNPYDKLTNEFYGFNGEDFTQVLDLAQALNRYLKTGLRDIIVRPKKG
jgi:hypothetical protein